jgi:5-methylcytosine-specific restriction endonuclease McrA
MMRPCLGYVGYRCGELTRESRCASCKRVVQRQRDQVRGTAAQRGYGLGWAKIRRAELERDGYDCQHCGAPARTVDHLLPLAQGGETSEANLVAACGRCNYTRGGGVRAGAGL